MEKGIGTGLQIMEPKNQNWFTGFCYLVNLITAANVVIQFIAMKILAYIFSTFEASRSKSNFI